MSPTIGMRIMFIRENLDINQDGLASILNMSRSNISAIENGRVSPSLSTICSLCLLFNVYADWLILGIGNDPVKENLSKFFCFFEKEIGKLKPLIPNEHIQSCIHMFATKLKLHRKELKLTQEDITKKLGIPRTSYIEIEKGRSNTTAKVLSILLNELEISADWFLFNIKPEEHDIIYPRDKILTLTRHEKETVDQEGKIIKNGKLGIENLTKEQVQVIRELIDIFQKSNNGK
jgi:transcriptional regulator with XRE-family HTH domain